MALTKDEGGQQFADSKIPVDGQHHESRGDVGPCDSMQYWFFRTDTDDRDAETQAPVSRSINTPSRLNVHPSLSSCAEPLEQVVFDTDNLHRRRASMVTSDDTQFESNSRKERTTSCFLHQFLESRKAGRSVISELKDISEDKKEDKSPLSPDTSVHSRLLTKRQLLDMRSDIRDLSKRLGNLKLKLRVKTVFVLTKAHDETLIDLTRELVDWLLSKERDTPYIV